MLMQDSQGQSAGTTSQLFLCVVQLLSHVQLFSTPWTAAHQLPCLSLSPRACSNSCPLSQWRHSTISSSVIPFSSCLQHQGLVQGVGSSHQSIGALASASVLPMNIQGWFPSEWTGWISLQSKGLSRVFSNTTVERHQFFSAQPSLWSNSHIHKWPLEKL